MHYDYDEERYVLDIPTECPKCGDELKLETKADGKSIVYCDKAACEYELDVTNEFQELARVQGEDNEADEDDEENEE